uniref:FERM and PDZ domain-containing protein 4 n=1 Tax=Aceria tosichella TaxID=561515 RepID=A0A6G1SDU3_9ACAR
MEAALEGVPRICRIRRSHHLGYGFIAGSEFPTMVKMIEPNGPSFKRLLPGDVIMAVNGIDVEHSPREQIIKMIQMSQDEIEIKVRQPSYEEIIRAKNLADPKFYMFNKSDHSSNQNIATRPTHSPSSLHHRKLPSPLSSPTSPSGPFAMNRLVTSIAQQQQSQPAFLHNTSNQSDYIQHVHARHNPKMVLKQRTDDNKTVASAGDIGNNPILNGTATLGRRNQANHNTSYGRHSPLPQRCKSSMDKMGKKFGDNGNDQPMLKRSNTMRPIRPPAKVLEILKVVIRIYFEDGHTKVLNYNQDTTVAVILNTLNDRLLGSSPQSDELRRCFGLVLTVNSEGNSKDQITNRRKMLHILDENDSIMKIGQLPYAEKLRLLYRMIHPPTDVTKLYTQNKVAFDYLYKQSCNDLRLERFCPELEPEIALKLSALHIVEYVYSNHPKDHGNSKDPKLYMRLVKKTPGLHHFVPVSMFEQGSDKKSKKRLKTKLLDQLKKNFEEFDFEPPKVRSTTNLNHYTSTSFHELALPGLKSSPSDYVKLLFLNYLSQLPCFGNSKRPLRASTSPVDRNSAGDCSSSMESVPRTSDSSPLLKQERNLLHHNLNNARADMSGTNTISKLAQMNSMRSLSSSIQAPNNTGPSHDQIDMAQTPSIGSISSITFNMQSSPSPPQTSSHASQQSESYLYSKSKQTFVEPSPMPRQQIAISKAQEYNSIERIYSQRYFNNERSIDDLFKNAILLPPPPTPTALISQFTHQKMLLGGSITPILTDRDLDRLRVPPPPRISHH